MKDITINLSAAESQGEAYWRKRCDVVEAEIKMLIPDDLFNKVICDDCLLAMERIPDKSIDMILCDLPYGITACKWDKIIPFDLLWGHYRRIIKARCAIVLTASQPFTSALVMSNVDMFRYEWNWIKSISTGFCHCKNAPLKNHENIIVFSDGVVSHRHLTKNRMEYNPQDLVKVDKPNRRGSLGFSGTMERKNHSNSYPTEFTGYPRTSLFFKNDGNTLHPTQKPVALFEYLIKTYTNEGDIVLDNCAGSGTTGLACRNTNRNFILIEKEPKYVEIINSRIFGKETAA